MSDHEQRGTGTDTSSQVHKVFGKAANFGALPEVAISGAERQPRDPIRFIESIMVNPETGKPFVLLDCERQFLRHATMIGPDGRLIFPEMVYSGPKKLGKSSWGAICLLTFVLLLGNRYSEGYAVANDFDQAQSKVFEMARRIVEASPALRNEAKITADRIVFTKTGSFIAAIASEYAGAAGSAPTISVFDELWGYQSERARRLFDEMIYVPTRKISCRLTVTYAGFTGESELLESLYQRGMAQPLLGPDLRAGDGMLCFWTHDTLAPWQTENWKADMRRSLRGNQYLRMIENRWVSAETQFIDMALWDRCVDPGLTRSLADRTLSTYAAVDASVKHDSTALALVMFDKPSQRVKLLDHKIFQPSPENPLNFERSIENTLLEWQARFALRAVLYDPYQMAASAQRLVRAGVRMVEFPQTTDRLTAAGENLYTLIQSKNLWLYRDPAMRTAISHAVAVESARGWRIAKIKQSHKIDIVIALAMAALAAVKSPRHEIITANYCPMDGGNPDTFVQTFFNYRTNTWERADQRPINLLGPEHNGCHVGHGTGSLPPDLDAATAQRFNLAHNVRRP